VLPCSAPDRSLWGPNIVSQGLIWASAVAGGSASAGSRDGFTAAVPDRLAYIRVDRAARPISGVEGRRDLGITASARVTPPPDRHPAAIVGGPGDPCRVRAVTTPAPSTPPVHHATDASAVARCPGEAALDLSQARTWTATDPAHNPGPGIAVGDREPDLGISPHRRRDRRSGQQDLPSHRLGDPKRRPVSIQHHSAAT
jgi:hypothetical protein